LRKAVNRTFLPQPNCTNGGTGFWSVRVRGRGVRQANSVSTSLDTSPPLGPDSSRNISRLSWRGWEPVNSGGEVCLAPVAGLRVHSALFWIEYSLGLNLNSIRGWPLTVVLGPVPDAVGSTKLK
jgi:hypothetical protein